MNPSKLARSKLCLFMGRHQTRSAGIWVYAYNFAKVLAKNLDNLSVVYAGMPEWSGEIQSSISGKEVSCLPELCGSRRLGFLKDLLYSPKDTQLFHGMANTVPLLGTFKRVLTLHDLFQAYPFEKPQGIYARLRSLWYRFILNLYVRRADLVLAVHPRIADEIREHFRDCKKVEVVYSPLAPAFVAARLSPATQRKNLLAFASSDKRKNIELLIEVFDRYGQDLPVLELVASNQQVQRELASIIEQRALQNKVRVLSNIRTEDLVVMMQKTKALVFPSLAEGFGLPIYEALSQGAAVVCKDDYLLPEIKDNKLVFNCDVRDALSIRSAIMRALNAEIDFEHRESTARQIKEILAIEKLSARLIELYEQALA